MSELLEVIQDLQDTEAAISRASADAAKYPEKGSLLLNVKSLQKRFTKLEDRFTELTASEELDVCTYRLIADDDRPYTVSALTKTLGNFQSLLTIVYNALKSNEPKERARTSAEISAESALNFSYTFSGSLGFVFTMPKERVLLGETVLDLAMTKIFEMAKCNNSNELKEYAKLVGIAPIRKIYEWATSHRKAGLSTDIKWKRGDKEISSLLLQTQELDHLCEVIDETSETKETRFTVPGILIGGDIQTKDFHFIPESGEDIKGKLADTFKIEGELHLNRSYKNAELLKTTKVFYSTEEEEIHYYLISLE